MLLAALSSRLSLALPFSAAPWRSATCALTPTTTTQVAELASALLTHMTLKVLKHDDEEEKEKQGGGLGAVSKDEVRDQRKPHPTATCNMTKLIT